jgi:hypothetical protein
MKFLLQPKQQIWLHRLPMLAVKDRPGRGGL